MCKECACSNEQPVFEVSLYIKSVICLRAGMNKTKPMILIVEDEAKLAKVLSEYLAQLDYSTHWIANGTDVLPWIRTHSSHLMLLDLMLPGKDGLSIFRELRTFSSMPVMMMTARIDEIDRLIGLELGADDYICKPYSPREVVARVKNVLHRTFSSPVEHLDHQPCAIEINPFTMVAKIDSQILNLTPSEFRLLQLLFNNVNCVYSREQLLNHIYDNYRVVTHRTIDGHIKNLRKKLKKASPTKGEIIKSVYGVGYKLEITTSPALSNGWL